MGEQCWACPNDWMNWVVFLQAGLEVRNRWRLPVVLAGMLFANGHRTVTSWLRAAGITDTFADYYYFLQSVGRKSRAVATRLLFLVAKSIPAGDKRLELVDHRRHTNKAQWAESRGGGKPSQPNSGSRRAGISLRTRCG